MYEMDDLQTDLDDILKQLQDPPSEDDELLDSSSDDHEANV